MLPFRKGVITIADGSVVIDVVLDNGQVAQGVANLNSQLGGIEQSGSNAAMGIGRIVAALGLVELAKKGIDMVKGALDGAISRYDTLGGFPKILAQMGFDSEQSGKAINKLSEGISGLPTTLDSVAATTQKLAIMTGDLDGAVDTTLALNNAFIASGSNSADASRGLVQYSQMLSKGSVDMMSWRTLQETMGVALNDTAKAFGFTGRSAQNDLYDALKEGDITFDQFNSKIIELSGGTNGFAERALTASAGIRTAFSNMKTSIVRGVTGILGAIDNMLADTSLKSIENVISIIGKSFSSTLTKIADGIPVVVDKIKEIYSALEPWLPLIKSVTAGVVAMIVAYAAFNSVKRAIDAIRNAQLALNEVMAMNPWLLIVGAVIAAAVLVYYYWEPIKAFFIKLWEGIKTVSAAVWEWIKNDIGETVNGVKAIWSSITGFFSNLWEGIKSIVASVVEWFKSTWSSITGFFINLWSEITSTATSVWDSVVNTWNTVVSYLATIFAPMIDFFKDLWTTITETATTIWDTIIPFFSRTWENIKTIAKAAWVIIKNAVLAPILLLIDLLTGDFDRFKSDLSQIWDNIKTAAGQIWGAIKDQVVSYVTTLVTVVKTLFNAFINTIVGYFKAISQTIANVLGELAKGVEMAMQWIKGIIDSAWRFIENLWMTIIQSIVNATGVDFELIRYNIMVVLDTIKQMIDTAWNFVRETFQNVLAFLKALVTGDFQGMKDAISNQLALIKETIGYIWSDVKEIFSNVLEAIKTYVKTKFEDMKNTAKQKSDETKANIATTWENIKTFFINTIEAIKTTVKNKFEEMKTSVGEKMTAAKNKITEIWESVKTFFTEIDLKQMGKDIIQGLIDGITSKVKAVGNAIKDVTGAITGKIRDILDIHSPSRWMRDMIGKNMMLGWRIGIDREKSSILAKAGQMAEWMKPAVSGFVNKYQGVAAPIGNVMPISAISDSKTKSASSSADTAGNLDQLVGAIDKLAGRPVKIAIDAHEFIYATIDEIDDALELKKKRKRLFGEVIL